MKLMGSSAGGEARLGPEGRRSGGRLCVDEKGMGGAGPELPDGGGPGDRGKQATVEFIEEDRERASLDGFWEESDARATGRGRSRRDGHVGALFSIDPGARAGGREQNRA